MKRSFWLKVFVTVCTICLSLGVAFGCNLLPGNKTNSSNSESENSESLLPPTSAEEHTHSYNEQVFNPSCVEGGYTLYVCDCGDSYTGNYTSATGHSYKDGYCLVCGAKDNQINIPTTDSSYFNFTLLLNDTYSISAKDVTNLPNEVSLPSSYNGKPITEIAEQGFAGCDLNTLVIPEGIKVIAGRAFYGSKMGNLYFPTTITTVFYNSFGGIFEYVGGNGHIGSLHIKDLKSWFNIDFAVESVENGWGPSSPIWADNFYVNEQRITELAIPEGVTKIKVGALTGAQTITKVTIPSSVTTIDPFAFYFVNSLEEVVFAKNSKLTTIGAEAFGATSLKNIVLPEGLTTIGECAFFDCPLEKIYIPSTVNYVGDSAFGVCTSLAEVHISDLSAWCNIDFIHRGSQTDDGLVTADHSNPLMNDSANLYLNGNLLTELVIPQGVETIKKFAFNGFKGNKVVIPKTVKIIELGAFLECYSLAEVINNSSYITVEKDLINNGSVGYYALEIYNANDEYQNKFLNDNGYVGYYTTTVVNPKSQDEENNEDSDNLLPDENGFVIQEIDGEVVLVEYLGCEENIKIPEGVTIVGEGALYECQYIKSVEISNSVTIVGESAFGRCYSLRTVIMGNGVVELGARAFEQCALLEKVKFAEQSSLKIIGGYAFRGCYQLKEFVIPEGVAQIGYGAFYDCSSLTKINIPSSVTSIQFQAFMGCHLAGVYITDLKAWCNIDFDAMANPLEYANNLYLNNEVVNDLIIPSKITEIKPFAFNGFLGKSVVISSSVTEMGQDNSSIARSVFNSPYATTYCETTSKPDGWVDSWCRNSDSIYWYSENEPTTSGNYWHYVNGVPTKW